MKLFRRLLRQLGSGNPDAAAAAGPEAIAGETAQHPALEAAPGPDEADVLRAFSAWLLGAGPLAAGDPTPPQQRLLRALHDVAQPGTDDPQVPRLPSVLPRLMRLVRRDDFSARELAGLLASEPALLGEVMRLANAPAYRGRAAPLASLEAAVALLGQAGMQAVLARAVMAPVFGAGQGRPGAKAATALWELAGRCAEECARQCPPGGDPFEARLAGMVSCTGWLVAVRLVDRHAPGEPLRVQTFHDQLAREATRLSARIARSWHLPDAVVQAVAALDRPAGEAPPGSLAALLRQADRAAKAAAAQAGRSMATGA